MTFEFISWPCSEFKLFIITPRGNSCIAVEYTNIQYNWWLTRRRFLVRAYIICAFKNTTRKWMLILWFLPPCGFFWLLIFRSMFLNICFCYWKITYELTVILEKQLSCCCCHATMIPQCEIHVCTHVHTSRCVVKMEESLLQSSFSS